MLAYESNDFRHAAAAESQKLLASGGASPAPTSCCLAFVEGEECRAACKRQIFVHLFILLVLFGLGGLTLARPQWIGLPIWAGGFFIGIASVWMALANIICCLPARRLVRQRLGSDRPSWGAEQWVSIENTNTVQQFKWVPEDIAMMICYPALRCVHLEGVSYRYVILGDDVISVSPISANNIKGARIDYRIGEVVLSLVLTDQSIGDRVRLYGGRQTAALTRILETLGPQTRLPV